MNSRMSNQSENVNSLINQHDMPYFKISEFLTNLERKLFNTILQRSIYPVLREVDLRRKEYVGQRPDGLKKPMEFWSDVQIVHWHFRRTMLSHQSLEEKIIEKYLALSEPSRRHFSRTSHKPRLVAGRWSDILRNTYNESVIFILIEKRPPIPISFFKRQESGTEYEFLTGNHGDLIILDRENYIFESEKDPFIAAIL